MSVNGVLVEFENKTEDTICTNSGIFFGNKYVIVTSNMLIPYLEQFDLNRYFNKFKPGIFHYSNLDPFDKELEMKIVIKETNNTLIFKKAKIMACFVCNNILKSNQRYLKNWSMELKSKEHDLLHFLSLFFILKITTRYKDNLENDIKDLKASLMELLVKSRRYILHNGLDVFIESTPFGNRAFLNSYSQGVISNKIGLNSCFLLTDCPSAPGCEGCPVFIKTKDQAKIAVGIVISCLNWWKGESIGLTLTANLVPLLEQMLQINKNVVHQNLKSDDRKISKELNVACSQCLVQVICGSGWGTGILLDKNKGVFLTNSHVIEDNYGITVCWKDEQIHASLLYKTPNSEVYDIAILQCSSLAIKKLDMLPVHLSLKQLTIGEEIFAAGHSLFSRDLKPMPSITKGHISQIHKSMIQTTAIVLPGTSGGAIFNLNGHLLGIIVCNIKMDDTGIVYPRINMAIPISAIYSIIKQFLETEDLKQLQRLHSDNPSVLKEWLPLLGKL